MLSETRLRETISAVIFCLGLFFGLAPFANAGETPKPDYTLCGHIKDAQTSQPVTDAIVRASGGPISDVQTDANGFYCFEKIREDGNYRISIDSNEYIGIYDYQAMPTVNLSKDKQTTKDFKLEKACMIKVQVVDEANQPIEGAELTANIPDGERNIRIGTDMLRKRTDKNGFVLLGGFPPSTKGYLVIAIRGKSVTTGQTKDGAGIVRTQWDYAPGKLIAILNDTDVVETDRIVLQKGVEAKGYAEYEDGVPAADLHIYAYPDWWSSYHSPEMHPVDANGFFTLRNIVPGIYRLQANIPRGQGGSVGITILQTRLPLPDNETLTLTIPEKSPQSLVSIRGKLIFFGAKIPHFVNIEASSLKIRHHPTFWQNYRGDACDTNFVIDRLEPGKYQLTFSGENVERKVLENIKAPAEGLEVELSPAEKLNLKGIVLNPETGRPIQNFKARARKIKILRGANYTQPDKWLEVDDAEGRFTIETTGPGIYQVQISADGFAWTWSEDINTDSNQPVIIKLTAGGSIKGSVVDEKGNPVNGALLIPLSMGGDISLREKGMFVSDDGSVRSVDGAFTLNNLPPGKETLKVVHQDYAPLLVKDINVLEGQTADGIKIILLKGATIEGYVYDPQDKPESGVCFKFRNTPSYSDSKAGQIATVVTDSNGYYLAAGLPDETCYITRQDRGEAFGVIKRMIIPRNGDTVRLDFGGKPFITGTVILDGQPLANQKVMLSAGDGPDSPAFTCYCLTDNNGGFRFTGAPLGRYSIYYRRPPENEYKMVKLATVFVDGRDIDLGVIPQQPTCKVLVYIEQETNEPGWEAAQIFLLEGFHGKSARTANFADKSAEPGQPYVFSYIAPGDYTIVVNRTDGLYIQQEIKVEAKDTSVSLKLPVSTASISGRITGAQPVILAIWQKDEKIIGYIQAKEDGTYKKENLPAGRYSIVGNPRIDPNQSLLEVELSEGEHKNIDIDANTSSLLRFAVAVLKVQVVDNHGIPIPGANVLLEGDSGTIEPSSGEHFMAKPGNYILRASYPGFKETRQQITMKVPDEWPSGYQPQIVVIQLEKQ